MVENIVKRRPRKERPLFCAQGADTPEKPKPDPPVPPPRQQQQQPQQENVNLSPPTPARSVCEGDDLPVADQDVAKLFDDLLNFTRAQQEGSSGLGEAVAARLNIYSPQWWCRTSVKDVLDKLQEFRAQETQALLSGLLTSIQSVIDGSPLSDEEALSKQASALEREAIQAAEEENWELSATLSDTLQNLLFEIRSKERFALTKKMQVAGMILNDVCEIPKTLAERSVEEWLVTMSVASSSGILCGEGQNFENAKESLYDQSNAALERLAEASKLVEECRSAIDELDQNTLPELEERHCLIEELGTTLRQQEADIEILLDEERELELKLREARERRQAMEKAAEESRLAADVESRGLNELSSRYQSKRNALETRLISSDADCTHFESALSKIQCSLTEMENSDERVGFIQECEKVVQDVQTKRIPELQGFEQRLRDNVRSITDDLQQQLSEWKEERLHMNLVRLYETASEIRITEPKLDGITNQLRSALEALEHNTDGSDLQSIAAAISHLQEASSEADNLKIALQKAGPVDDELNNVRSQIHRLKKADMVAATNAKNEAMGARNFRLAAVKAQALQVMEEKLRELRARETQLAEKQAVNEQKSSLLSQILSDKTAVEFCGFLGQAVASLRGTIRECLPDKKSDADDEAAEETAVAEEPAPTTIFDCVSSIEKWLEDLMETLESFEAGLLELRRC